MIARSLASSLSRSRIHSPVPKALGFQLSELGGCGLHSHTVAHSLTDPRTQLSHSPLWSLTTTLDSHWGLSPTRPCMSLGGYRPQKDCSDWGLPPDPAQVGERQLPTSKGPATRKCYIPCKCLVIAAPFYLVFVLFGSKCAFILFGVEPVRNFVRFARVGNPSNQVPFTCTPTPRATF